MIGRLALAACALLLSVRVASGLDITECGQRVPSGETGTLQGDLDCPPVPQFCDSDESIACTQDSDCPDTGTTSPCIGPAVYLEHHATLDLNGHTMKGGRTITVFCTRDCTVRGPGNLEGTDERLVHAKRNVEISDVFMDGGGSGVTARFGRVRARNITANNTTRNGVFAYRSVRGDNITANGNTWGIVTAWGSVIGSNITTNGNANHAISASGLLRVTNLTATGNVKGVVCVSASLRDSTVTGNGALDIRSKRRPRLKNTVCGKSGKLFDGSTPWFVCADD